MAMGTSVALSGGGHRASLFGLGSLLYLADVGENSAVSSIASVSGGSLTNGHLAQTLDYRTASGDEVRAASLPFVQTLARRGTFLTAVAPKVLPLVVGNLLAAVLAFSRWPVSGDYRIARLAVYLGAGAVISYVSLGRSLLTPWGHLYGTLLVPTALAALIAPFLLPGPSGLGWTLLRLASSIVLLLVWIEVVLRLRGPLCLHTFRTSLFPEQRGKALLSGVGNTGLVHILCATELQTGDQIYFSPGFVYSYQLGAGTPGAFDLASAVQASASLPGAFPPQRQPTSMYGFNYELPDKPPADHRALPPPPDLVLVDGGVYDNMGDEWAGGYDGRVEIWPGLAAHCDRPDRLIVVNASGGLRYRRLGKPWIPGMAEIQAASGDKDVLYDQTTAQRRRALIDRFRLAEKTNKGLKGALVHISQSPYHLPTVSPTSEQTKRARERLDALSVPEEEWRQIARQSESVKTTLAALTDETAARLIWHGYVLAAVNLHVILDLPMPDRLPSLDCVRGWVAGNGWREP